MRVYLLVFFLAIALNSGSTPVAADSSDDVFGPFGNGYTITCQHTRSAKERMVRVHYLEEDSQLPCEVRYYKPTERPHESYRVLWYARNTEGYCERKAELLVNRLRGWGWQCSEPEWSYDNNMEEEGNNATSSDDKRNDDSATSSPSDCELYGGYYCN